jgi:hypothetical protein
METYIPTVGWTVQQDLSHPQYEEKIKAACQVQQFGFQTLKVYPFDPVLPNMHMWKHNIFYGSVSFNNLVSTDTFLRKGVFFDPVTFSMKNYLRKWNDHMLSSEAKVTSFAELMSEQYPPDKLLFIRPDDDSKSFSGTTKSFHEISAWYEELKMYDNTNLTLDSPIIVGEPYSIAAEWRLWIVNKKVVASSRYRRYFKLDVDPNCPTEVISFAEQRCKEYVPHDIFVMDVCISGDQFYILECGCMNAAGLYAADVHAIVTAVTEFVTCSKTV